jgi:hypothetical protein
VALKKSTRTALTLSTVWVALVLIAAMAELLEGRDQIELTLVIGFLVIWIANFLHTWITQKP